MKRYLLYLLIVALLCAGCSAKDDGKSTDTLDVSLESSQCDNFSEPTNLHATPSETEPKEPVTEIGDYILDGTKLIGYIGNDTELTLPEEVTGIAADAFKDAPSAAQITKLNLGANVTEIEVGAFTGMHSLCTFTVDAQNPQFYAYEDHTLVSLDGTLFFTEIDETGEAFEFLFEGIIEEVEAGERAPDGFTSYVLGPAKVDIEFELYDEQSGEYRCFLSAVTAYGNEYILDTPLQMWWGNGSIQTIPGEGYFVVADLVDVKNDILRYVIFAEDGMQELEDSPIEIPSDHALSFYKFFRVQEDTELHYKRTLRKYSAIHALYMVLDFCVARDEFCEERGVVQYSGGKLSFQPENTFTISDKYDLVEVFKWCKENGVFEEYSTLDELLTANAEKYERGY